MFEEIMPYPETPHVQDHDGIKRPLIPSFTRMLQALQSLHSLIQLVRILKRPPHIPRHIPKRLLEPGIGILIRILHLRHIRHLPDEDRPDPAGIHPADIAVGFRVALRAVADAERLPLRQPGVYLVDAAPLVGLRPLRQGREEAAEIHPGGVAEDGGALWVVLVQEGAEEGVEVVGGGGEVEPGWLQGGGELGVEFGHPCDGGGVRDEGAAEDADGGGGHGYFDRVVDV